MAKKSVTAAHSNQASVEDPIETAAVSNGEVASAKVGSDPSAAKHFADQGDFGIPARKAKPGQQTESDDSDIQGRPLGSRETPALDDGTRETGVGAPDSGPGSGSGGDLDPDFVGIGSGVGIAISGERRTVGPDITETAIDSAGGNRPARGDNTLPHGTHGAGDNVEGSTIDRGDREVHMGSNVDEVESLSIADDDMPTSSSDGDRSSGEDIDDREAQVGTDD